MTARSVLIDLPGPTLREMTERQGAIYAFIVEFLGECGYPPSLREIAGHVGLASLSSVHAQLCQLEELGLIARTPDRARAITVVERDGAAA